MEVASSRGRRLMPGVERFVLVFGLMQSCRILFTKRSRIVLKIKNKELGTGCISLVLCVVGVLFGFSFKHFCIGDYILNGVGLNSWSNNDVGIHYTIFYSLAFFIPSFLIGLKHNNYGSRASYISGIIAGTIIFCYSGELFN